MLVEFTLKNYRSFKDRQIFSLIPDESKKEFPENIFKVNDKIEFLKVAIIYGANASGKSNFMKALQAFRNLALFSANKNPGSIIKEYEPYKFEVESSNSPTEFELLFLINKIPYRYAIKFTDIEISEESLLFYPQGREAKLFVRKGQKFEFGDYLKGQKNVVANLTNKNQLFLPKAAQNNITQLIEVHNFFSKTFLPIPFLDHTTDKYYINLLAKELDSNIDKDFIQNFKALLKSFDTGIVDFRVKKIEPTFKLEDHEFEVAVDHQLYNRKGEKIRIKEHPLDEESQGTQKLFVLAGLLLKALMNGSVIMIDEFERSLHPYVSSYIVKLFNKQNINRKGAQLIIATHDTNLLSKNILRRDQIWIAEKSIKGDSQLFSFSDINGVRHDIPFEKWYLTGRFGGIPSLKELNFELSYKDEAKS